MADVKKKYWGVTGSVITTYPTLWLRKEFCGENKGLGGHSGTKKEVANCKQFSVFSFLKMKRKILTVLFWDMIQTTFSCAERVVAGSKRTFFLCELTTQRGTQFIFTKQGDVHRCPQSTVLVRGVHAARSPHWHGSEAMNLLPFLPPAVAWVHESAQRKQRHSLSCLTPQQPESFWGLFVFFLLKAKIPFCLNCQAAPSWLWWWTFFITVQRDSRARPQGWQ